MTALIALEDGTTFHGRAFAGKGEFYGELVFNTSMTGYQEILTDPSYKGQIVTMTYPLIGNYGINEEDMESFRPHASGMGQRDSQPWSRMQSESSLRGASTNPRKGPRRNGAGNNPAIRRLKRYRPVKMKGSSA